MTTLWKSVNFTSAYANATTIGYQLYERVDYIRTKVDAGTLDALRFSDLMF